MGTWSVNTVLQEMYVPEMTEVETTLSSQNGAIFSVNIQRHHKIDSLTS